MFVFYGYINYALVDVMFFVFLMEMTAFTFERPIYLSLNMQTKLQVVLSIWKTPNIEELPSLCLLNQV